MPGTPSPGGDTAALSMPAAPAGVDSAAWSQLTSELKRALELTGRLKAPSAAPADALSKVQDFAAAPGTPPGTAVFSFSYRSTGDYDQNGEVNLNDLTPLGLNFGARQGDAGWNAAQVADGDTNGEVNLADVTPIAIHFGTRVSGFALQMAASPAESASWQGVADIAQSTGVKPPLGGYLAYSYSLPGAASGMYFRVVPFDGTTTPRGLGIPSNAAFFSSEMLPAPTGVQASDGIYSDRITVIWVKVTGATGYLVFRDDQSAPVATLGDVNAYDDAGVADTLPHTYWLKARDGLRESDFSAPDTGYRGAVQALEPPTEVHASDGAYTDHIHLSWSKPLGATGYKVFRDVQTAPLATVGDQAYYDDYALSDNFLHTYWVSATGPAGESALSMSDTGYRGAPATGTMVVLAWNDLGMHCMNQDFSELMILPPYNVLHAQVINRAGEEPQIVTGGVTVRFTIPENTHSADKTNFWSYAPQLFGVALAPDVGLTGNTLAGTLSPLLGPEGRNDWSVTGIPITPIDDAGNENPYNLAVVTVESAGQVTARTQNVVPVSWEISCNLCHNTPGITAATDILRKHDLLHGTSLESAKPVVCGSCHAQPPLGLAGSPGVPSLSSSMHTAHAPRMAAAGLAVECYACHPGIRTKCLRDVMFSAGITCTDCHGSMTDVGNPARSPWADEPRCGNCHSVAGHEYEQPGTLYRNSMGHHGVHCAACHGSPHAITPTVVGNDNLQAITLQGHPGTIDTCTVCHSTQPSDPFDHVYTPSDR